MIWFILAIILFVVAAVAIIVVITTDAKGPAAIVAVVTILVGVFLMWIATFWTNGPGEAKIMVNTFDRTYSEEVIVGAQSGFKPAWVDFVDYDLSNQELVYAGGDQAPSYTGGTVNGKEITVSVGGINGGSTQGNIDATFVYNLDSEAVLGIYKQYPYPDSQARFTKAIVEKQVLSTARQVPSDYSAVAFRGVDRAEAEVAMQDLLNDRLGKSGLVFAIPTIQDVRYPDTVEEALKAVEVANQKQQEAEANLRATEVSSQAQVVEAEAKAQAQIAAAQGEAEANRLLAASLTPEVLQQRYLDTLAKLAAEGNLVITDGTGSQVLVQR